MGDSVFGVQAARSARMLTFGYTSSYPATVLREAAADYVFDDYAALLPRLALYGGDAARLGAGR